jgi:1,4-alpha-glucan branching enzyme
MAVSLEPGKHGKSLLVDAPTATSVRLAGDFTRWQQEPINMQKGADGIWRTTVELEPGPHHYRFLVDGQWRDDLECKLQVPNPFGGQDAVRQVVWSVSRVLFCDESAW